MKKLAVFLVIGGILMGANASAESFYQVEVKDDVNTLSFDGIYAIGLLNSFKEFEEDKKFGKNDSKNYQNLKNFRLRITYGRDEYQGMIRVSFAPKLASGEKPMLGGGTSLGHTLVIYFSPINGEVVKVHRTR